MLTVTDLSYAIGDRQVLNQVSFSVADGEKVALVGSNGAGKSTLFRILNGELKPNEGEISLPEKVGYVPQTLRLDASVNQGSTVEEFMLEGRSLNQLAHELQTASEKLASGIEGDELARALDAYGKLQERFERSGGYEASAEVATILNGIGLKVGLDRKVSTLSGGEKTKLAFARSLFADADLLLLDEPTNHIDRKYYGWLGTYLSQIRKTVLVISHHPEFINPFTNKILELEKYTGRVREYKGTYETYLAQSALNEKTLSKQVEWLEKEIARLSVSALRLQHGGPNKAKAAQNIFGRIERLKKQREELANDMPSEERKMRFRFPVKDRPGTIVVAAKELSKSFGEDTLFRSLAFEVARGDRLVILGPNGSGKSTLLKLIVGQEKPTTGSIRFGTNVDLGYYAQEHENLRMDKTVIEEAQSASFQASGNLRDVLARFLFFQDRVFQKVASLSEGEKSRLSLCKLFLGGHNLLVMDEPTNYLDVASRNALVEALNDYDGTFIIVSHDSDLIKGIKPNKVLDMQKGSVRLYDETMVR